MLTIRIWQFITNKQLWRFQVLNVSQQIFPFSTGDFSFRFFFLSQHRIISQLKKVSFDMIHDIKNAAFFK